MRIALIWSRFGPYHIARLNAVASALAGHCGSVVGIEIASTDTIYAWDAFVQGEEFDRRTLFPGSGYENHTSKQIRSQVEAVLNEVRPDAVGINGWSMPEARGALEWCHRTGTKSILFSETKYDDEPRSWWKEKLKASLVRKFDTALVGGAKQRDYLLRMGFRSDLIFFGYDVVDNGYFASGAEETRSKAHTLRVERDLPRRFFFLCTRFIERKNVDGLLKAYAVYRSIASHEPWGLVIVGGGEELEGYRQIESDLRIEGVTWPGFIQYDELPIYYGLASGFVHPAKSEPWGLVLNEAAASGLAILSSQTVGAAYELVEEGHNGFLFDPFDQGSMVQALLKLASLDEQKLKAMRDASRAIAAKWSPSRFASGLIEAVEAT